MRNLSFLKNNEGNYWIGFLDLTISILIVFVFIMIYQYYLQIGNLKVQEMQRQFRVKFEEEFYSELKNDEIYEDRDGNIQRIRFSGNLLFRPAEYELNESARGILRRCSDVFEVLLKKKSFNFEKIHIEGHTDTDPITNRTQSPQGVNLYRVGIKSNWDLSSRRATEVVKFLTDSCNLDPGLFSAVGYSEHTPLDSDINSSVAKRKNRRIEIAIFYSTKLTE